jgi:hypothetical protein
MRYEDLWAAFRGFIDALDAGTMTTSDVRKAMLKIQTEEKQNDMELIVNGPLGSQLDSSPSNVS